MFLLLTALPRPRPLPPVAVQLESGPRFGPGSAARASAAPTRPLRLKMPISGLLEFCWGSCTIVLLDRTRRLLMQFIGMKYCQFPGFELSDIWI